MGGKRGEQREPDQSLCGDRAVGAYRQRPVTFSTPDRLDAKLDRGRARSAGGRERDRQAARTETVGQAVGNGAELRRLENIQRIQTARDLEDAIGRRSVLAGCIEVEAVGPIELNRRRRQEKRSAEIVGGEPGFADRLARGCFSELVGQWTCTFRARCEEIDGAADARIQMVGGKAGDGVYAGTTRGQRRPVVGLADAKRGDDADAGDGHDRPA